MRDFTIEELKEVLKKHEMWLSYEENGVRANLSYANLSYANLSGADLSGADLRGADLRGANLSYADLSYANLNHANLNHADLSGADLRGADLSGADLRGANLSGIKYSCLTSFYALQCPEDGSFIAYKKVKNFIVKMQVTESARRSSATSRKCRCSEALILEIQNLDGTKADVDEVVNKNYGHDTIYKVGELTRPDSFDEDRWNECSNGIHFFITREEAVQYE